MFFNVRNERPIHAETVFSPHSTWMDRSWAGDSHRVSDHCLTLSDEGEQSCQGQRSGTDYWDLEQIRICLGPLELQKCSTPTHTYEHFISVDIHAGTPGVGCWVRPGGFYGVTLRFFGFSYFPSNFYQHFRKYTTSGSMLWKNVCLEIDYLQPKYSKKSMKIKK